MCTCCLGHVEKCIVIQDGKLGYQDLSICMKEIDKIDSQLAKNVILYHENEECYFARSLIKDTTYIFSKNKQHLSTFLKDIYNTYFNTAKDEKEEQNEIIQEIESDSKEKEKMVETILEDRNEIIIE
jgi:hypothetical protein